MIKKYSQVYDVLKTTKFDEYLSDKRNNIHNELYTDALNSFIEETNKCIYYYSHYTVIKQPDGTEIMDFLTWHKRLNTISSPVAKHLGNSLFKLNIEKVDLKNFKILEIKNKVWYMPSDVIFIYTGIDPITHKIKKTKFGPYTLINFWNSSYIANRKDLNELMLGDIYVELEITYIDYVKGTISVYDRGEDRTFILDIDYINSNLKISNEYDGKMYSILKK